MTPGWLTGLLGALLLLPALAGRPAPAQAAAPAQPPGAASTGDPESSSPWWGEWGSFQQAGADGDYTGEGISIWSCQGGRCRINLRVLSQTPEGGSGHAGGVGWLEILSGTEAEAHLASLGVEHCTLRLSLESAGPALNVTPGKGDCGYYLTAGASFVHRYPLHARVHYTDSGSPACFASDAPARQALCGNDALTAESRAWSSLFLDVESLTRAADALTHEEAALSAMLHACDAAANAGDCLHASLARSTAELKARQAAWLASMTEPGDRGEAAAKAAAIAGRYARQFENGDVEGESFTSTNTMTLTETPDHGLRFSLELEFYNGHSCSLAGKAGFVRAGVFAYRQPDPDQPGGPLCVLEIVPEAEGVRLSDPTGVCRQFSCGSRGGYEDIRFTFADRRAPATGGAKQRNFVYTESSK